MSSGGTSTSSAGSSSSSVQLDGFRGDPEEQPIQEQEEGSSDGRDLDFNEENRDDSDDERERDWNDPRFLSGEDNDDRSTLNNEEEVSSEEDDHHHIQESSGNDSVVTNIGARGRDNRPTEESESEAGEEEKIGSEKGPPDAQDNNGASTSGARDANKEKEQESKPDEEGLDSGSGGTDGDTDHAGALGIHHSQV